MCICHVCNYLLAYLQQCVIIAPSHGQAVNMVGDCRVALSSLDREMV